MASASITVKYVNPPKEGKKAGNIKTTTDEFYGVFPELLDKFIPGGNYEIEYSTREFQGKTYKTVTKVNPHGNTGNGAHDPSEDMFAMGFMNRSFQGTCKVPDADIGAQMLRTLRKMWKESKVQPKAEPSTEEYLNDDIPF